MCEAVVKRAAARAWRGHVARENAKAFSGTRSEAAASNRRRISSGHTAIWAGARIRVEGVAWRLCEAVVKRAAARAWRGHVARENANAFSGTRSEAAASNHRRISEWRGVGGRARLQANRSAQHWHRVRAPSRSCDHRRSAGPSPRDPPNHHCSWDSPPPLVWPAESGGPGGSSATLGHTSVKWCRQSAPRRGAGTVWVSRRRSKCMGTNRQSGIGHANASPPTTTRPALSQQLLGLDQLLP